ncbi:uncharacterized protein LOC129720395 [Wyeomyia smithii]|uniref:uncharacterized protein LOC129720395 n=1 Tax=Wyeomyia smithii TaxID=174621 RepID=UPI002467F656|nr:uncharacterized protein LOC129720395 [Wyeomyia smithii]
MANVTVLFEYEEPEYCRLCLSEPSDDNELTKIGQSRICGEDGAIPVIESLLLIKLDPRTDSNSLICSTCLESLEEFHRYSIRCRANNVKLQKRTHERNQRQIALAKNAIDHTNVLDEVNEGDPIKVIIRMNAAGKSSIRVEIHKGPQQGEIKREILSPAAKQPQKTDDRKEAISTKSSRNKAGSGKLVMLPAAQFYFYHATNDSYGFIYGGYRYQNSVSRKKRTYWVCEQRKSHDCSTLLVTDKKYTLFFVNVGHNHDPPALRDNLIIYKPASVLSEVIQHEQIREQELTTRKAKQLETQVKQESSDSEDEDTCDEIFEISDSDDFDILTEAAIKVDSDEDEKPKASTSSLTKIRVDAGESMYVIEELA